MKKVILVVLGLMLLFVVVACGNKGDNDENNLNIIENSVEDLQGEKDPLDGVYGKTSLTLEDLDKIDEYRFPKSYKYIKYDWTDWNSTVETWDYNYPSSVNRKLLLPIHENMASREIVSSVLNDGKIETLVDIVLDNGVSYPVKYMINPDTLQYVQASFDTPTSTTLYTFRY